MDELERWLVVVGIIAGVSFAGWTASRAARDIRITDRLRGVIAALIAVTPPMGALLYWVWSLASQSSPARDDWN